MVSAGANPPHQLLGTSGSHASSADICQGKVRHHNSFEDRQHHCSRLHQQDGGDNITYTITANQGSVVMVHGMKHLATSTALTRSIADRESRIWSDRSKWRLSQALFQSINLQLGPPSTGLFASRLSVQLPAFVKNLLKFGRKLGQTR